MSGVVRQSVCAASPRTGEGVAQSVTDEGLASRARTSLALIPTLSRSRERGRGSAP
jgi:hypothetical protein